MAAPLDPMAKPYHKIPPPHFFVYIFPDPPPYNLTPPPPPPPPSPIFSTYNIRFQPSIRITFPLSHDSSHPPPPQLPQKKVKYSLTPVPSGPRIPKSGIPGRCRRRVNFRNSGNASCEIMKWRPKAVQQNSTKFVDEKESRKTRWKNQRGEYENFLPLEEDTTSVMIKNIPNKYTRKLLIQTLDNHCELENKKLNNGDEILSAYDFLYLPIDFIRRLNAGFAFVNFNNPEAAMRFRNAFHGKRWDFFDSPKIAEISRARIQGKMALINHCKGMDFTYGSKEYMPVWFEPARNGSGEACSKMFTVGMGKSF